MQQPLAYIPSPSQNSVHLGPLPLRGYALMIIIGVIVAVWLGERRWTARGGAPGTVLDIAVWAVPFGLVGGRLYHVITDNQLYFRAGRDPIGALEVWKGGLGIWGAVALGALGAYIGCRRRGISMRAFADAAAPGVVLAQAFGRWGNWFNQELYGRPTKLPWAVKIDPAHRPLDPKYAGIATYQPTFLYESLWCVGVAILVIWAEKRFRLAYGRTFALYVAAYTVGRAWIEWLRIDEAHRFLGLRLNDWTSLVVFLAAVTYLYVYRDRTEIPEGSLGTGTADAAAVPAVAAEPGGAGTAPAEKPENADDSDKARQEDLMPDGPADENRASAEAEAAPKPAEPDSEADPQSGESEPAGSAADDEAAEADDDGTDEAGSASERTPPVNATSAPPVDEPADASGDAREPEDAGTVQEEDDGAREKAAAGGTEPGESRK